IGSTPTCVHTTDLSGVTEVRPGNYSFFDLFQAQLGSCRVEDIALSVLATVIGHYPDRQQLVIDAGALALSKDAGAQHLDPDCGFGQICDLGGQKLPGLHLRSLSQEHGIVVSRSGVFPADLGVGSRVRILPNHACLTAACHDRYHQVEGEEVVGWWTPVRGW
ncbi:MAG: DSD1 family PLP-dependent enzyme, partial [Myxococcota bacterium]|nr:DSD1 family PLP-dependent enzyme [Myxococcota bacterium]